MTLTKRIRIVGIILLIGGLLAGAIIYFSMPPDQDRTLILGVDVRTNRDVLQLEKMGGKSAVLMADFEEWFAGLWHGRRLAYTVAVLSIGGCVCCYLLADLVEFSPGDDRDQPATSGANESQGDGSAQRRKPPEGPSLTSPRR